MLLLQTRLISKRKLIVYKSLSIFLTQLPCVSKANDNYFQKVNQGSVGETPIS